MAESLKGGESEAQRKNPGGAGGGDGGPCSSLPYSTAVPELSFERTELVTKTRCPFTEPHRAGTCERRKCLASDKRHDANKSEAQCSTALPLSPPSLGRSHGPLPQLLLPGHSRIFAGTSGCSDSN